MDVRTRRYIFYAIWFLLLSLPLITFLKNTNLSTAFSNPVLILNTFQRLTGMTAYILLFIQIMLGAFMDHWVQVIGAKAYKFHITQGLFIYGLVLVHPTLYLLITYQLTNNLLQSFLVILPSFKNQTETLLVFGKTALLLLTVSVTAAYFRTKPFFRRNWKAFHILNYLVFYLVFYHARIGTDLASQPFDTFYWLALFLVTMTIIYKLFYPRLFKMFQQKLNQSKV